MKKIYQLLLLLSVFAVADNLKASHMMGSDVSYICISPGKYKIIAKVYRDCRGISLNSPTIKAFSPSCASDVAISYTRTSINDISPTCVGGTAPCNPQNTTVGTEGIEEHVFEGIVDFNTSPFNTFVQNNCCEVYFSVNQCCRNGAITTINPGDLYTEAMINLCNIGKKCNTSPQLTIPPVAYICCNLPFTFNNGASEIIDGDSLSYSLANPLSGHNTNESYSGSFTPTIPMTPFCIPPGVINCKPLPNAKPPRGFYFDGNTGDIIFTPTNCTEVGVIVIQIDEYRKDSSSTTGEYKHIGRTRRDMQLVVTKCADNNPPQIPTTNKWGVCEGNKICFTIKSKDTRTANATKDDTTQMTWNYGIPGATFRIIDPTAREKEAEFCWQTKVGDAREFAYQFTVTAVDDNCPRPGKINKGFLVTVKPKAETKRKYDILDCGKLRFKSNPKDTVNFKGTYTYEWTIRDSTNAGFPYYKGFKQMDSIKFKRGGKYIITHTINNIPVNCPTTYIDTVILPPVLDVELAFGKDTFVCAGDSLVVRPIIAYGYQPFKYHWESPTGTFKAKDTLDRFAIKPIANTSIMLKITDKNKCVDTDTIKIKYQPLPVVNIGPDRRICTYDNITLDAQNDDTMRYFWQPDGDSTRLKTINVAGKYWVKVIDYLGCNKSDTMELYVNDTVVAIAKPDREICINDTLKVKANRRPLGYTRTMSWTDLNTGIKLSSDSSFIQKITQIVPRSYDLFLKVTQGTLAKGGVITCEDHDTLKLTVNPLPTFLFAGLPPRCYTDGPINLTAKEVAIAKDLTNAQFKDIRYFQKYKKPSWVTGGPVGTSPYIYDFPKFITNAQVPAAGLRDTICYEYRDFKGCYNHECKPVRLNPNPDVKVNDGIFCQRAGLISLDKLAVIPFIKVGGVQSWRVLEVPPISGVDPAAILIEDNTVFPITYWMDPGIEGENNKTGDYKVEYCFKNPSTGCQRCDTTTVTVVRLPEIQFDPIPNQCINYPLLALDSFVVEKNSGKRFPAGTWECVAYGGSRDMNIPPIKNAINNSVKSKKYFDPSTDQNGGQYLLKFTDVASGCPVTDSTEITVNGLPQIKLPRADTLCSSAGLFQLTTNYPVGDVNGKWSEPASQTPQYVSGSNFDPSKSPKTTQYEGPVKLYYAYTNPLTKCTNIDSAYKTIQSQPEALINNTKPYQQCEDQLYNMDATTKWAKYRTWTSSGDGLFSTSDTMLKPSYKGGVLDTMNGGTVILTVTTNKEGVCPQASDNITLILEPYPQFRLPIHFVQCEPATIDFTSYVSKPNGSANLRYSWYFGNGDSLSRSANGNPQGIKYPVTKEGWYDLRLTVHNQWGAAANEVCSITIDSLDYIKVLPQPKSGFTSDPDFFTTVAFPKFKFYNTTQIKWGKVSYVWSFNSGVDPDDTSTLVNPIHTYPADTTTYFVNLYSEFRHSKIDDPTMESDTDMLCTDNLPKLVKVGPDVTVFVPTAFSPEGTGPGKNNVFNAVVNGEKSFHIEVYSRWGEKLWETDNKYETWNGKFQAEDCQQDVYVWVVRVTDYKNEEYRYEGTVTLLR